MGDAEMVGRIILLKPTMQMVEVLAFSTRLDLALVVELDMEGGRTGRTKHFPPSRLERITI